MSFSTTLVRSAGWLVVAVAVGIGWGAVCGLAQCVAYWATLPKSDGAYGEPLMRALATMAPFGLMIGASAGALAAPWAALFLGTRRAMRLSPWMALATIVVGAGMSFAAGPHFGVLGALAAAIVGPIFVRKDDRSD
ncbi:MAG TPA: hypothetical protein VKE69_02200 [Planctomycetota bacterium]|nr:hypothetical protein [Planctomycetota bacterium]